ncbi:hypothetical protein [Fructobacillus evanidus]|uniref:Uncharacterized protein n=1 Tax=Fructobacillus evanidus TaxID=3064281 RepID=A0ABN9YNT2_9LACO|nr:unnamed protein product [Fructobacillus sp. LMG 32999]CAK1222185.1 unnamed protein product [Fructobacillus sp. LMG 32999]CAK1225945.1 unnamed protein product [Fructobacillus sp. LMG 32999]CAK1226173.1 unnamed protein product [Fructobacillus sp. LMG 32999]CAK1226320.1 unnamed protein product [Fructobacillus sp. LMG 32999]
MLLPVIALVLVLGVAMYSLLVVVYFAYKIIATIISLIFEAIGNYRHSKWMKKHPEEVERVNKAIKQLGELFQGNK